MEPEVRGWHTWPVLRTADVDDPAPAGQSYIERPPIPALAGLVSSVWIQQVSPDADPYTHRNIPNGGVELLCLVGSVPRVVGPLTRPLVEVLAPGTTVVGVRFRPGAAPSVLGLPASELVDLAVETDELWGRSAVALGERVAGAASPKEALVGLQRHIVGWLGDAPGPDPLVSEAVRRLMPWGTDVVGSLTSSLSISDRQLRRRCQAAVGLAPKALHRMLRFQGFLALTQDVLARGRAPTDRRGSEAPRAPPGATRDGRFVQAPRATSTVPSSPCSLRTHSSLAPSGDRRKEPQHEHRQHTRRPYGS